MAPTTSAAKCHHKVDPLMGVPGMERPPIESQADLASELTAQGASG